VLVQPKQVVHPGAQAEAVGGAVEVVVHEHAIEVEEHEHLAVLSLLALGRGRRYSQALHPERRSVSSAQAEVVAKVSPTCACMRPHRVGRLRLGEPAALEGKHVSQLQVLFI
jgi:hypothetical protein